MKKVLIIANLFHASPRITGIAPRLADFGYEPTMITVPLKSDKKRFFKFDEFRKKVRVIETPYYGDVFSGLRKILNFFGFNKNKSLLDQVKSKSGSERKKSFVDNVFKAYLTFFAYPDEERKWKAPALKAAADILNKEKFDIILSSSSPVVSHIVAGKLKKKFSIPWVADLRDLWTQNHNYSFYGFRKLYEKPLELKTLKNANALVTVSDLWMEKLKLIHKDKDIYAIMNGFDPDLASDGREKITEKFTITYTGQIYDGKQDPAKILIALKNLIDKKIIKREDIELRFFGPEKSWLAKEIENCGLKDIAKQYGVVPRDEAIKKQHESQVLLKLNWEDQSHKGGYTGKIFEYLAAKRPILATGGWGDVTQELLNETKAGLYASKIEDIECALKDYYSDYKENKIVSYKGDWDKINKYSYTEAANKFAILFDKILSNNKVK